MKPQIGCTDLIPTDRLDMGIMWNPKCIFVVFGNSAITRPNLGFQKASYTGP